MMKSSVLTTSTPGTDDLNLLGNPALIDPDRLVWPGAWVGHIPFASWLIGVLRPSIFVELGTHTGNSYNAFCQAIQEQKIPVRAFAVDTWKGDSHAGAYDDRVFDEFSKYHTPRYGSFSTLLRMTFDESLDRFADGSVDLLHIDGLHTYEAVRHDFESWRPKLSSRAVVLFHDIEVRRDDFGVFKLWGELASQFPNFAFRHSHGLGVLLAGEQTHPSLLALANNDGAGGAFDIARTSFEALGLRFEQHAAMADQALLLSAREEEISQLQALVAQRDRDVLELRTAIDVRDAELARVADSDNRSAARRVDTEALLARAAELQAALAERNADVYALTRDRDEHASLLASTRRSTSWRLTAPLRLAGLLARGRFAEAGQRVAGWRKKLSRPGQKVMARLRARLLTSVDGRIDHASHRLANDAKVQERNDLTAECPPADPLTARAPARWPRIDVSVVTYNSARWIDGFVDSLEALDYPKDLIALRFVDNQSTDATVQRLRDTLPRLQSLGMSVDLLQRPNLGFGAGHNAGLAGGSAEFCLVTNIDLEFEPEALSRIVSVAVADLPSAAAWEFRQKPYEHPKYYDPVTGTTGWNSHACVLMRRSAFDAVGGYDKHLFMYGEDVELSWRLRRAGGVLRYCPAAVVMHYSYDAAGQTKPLQYTGSNFANLYLRLKYGSGRDARAVPLMALALLVAAQPFVGARRAAASSMWQLLCVAPAVLRERKASEQAFVFRGWDYEMARDGAFVEAMPLPAERPLVSVITRSYAGRDRFLRQAILSVAHQTWPNIEHVIVEDGPESLRPVVEAMTRLTGAPISYFAIDKAGRSATGNAGLRAARGRWCVFLDDDDLLFADHIELLVQTMLQRPDAVATYSPALEVLTHYPARRDQPYHESEIVAPPALRQSFNAEMLRHHNFMAIQSVLFERRLFLERGGFELDMDALEDWVLWNLYAYQNVFVYVPKATSLYRIPADANARSQRNQVFVTAFPFACERISRRLLEVNLSAVNIGQSPSQRPLRPQPSPAISDGD